EELGIAHADLVEAGLLTNPFFEVEVRYPHTSRLKTNIEYLITSSLLDMLVIPLRTRLAATELEQTKLKVAHEILNLAFDVRETYYGLVAEQIKVQSLDSMVELTSIMADLSSKQEEVGNIIALEQQLAQTSALQAALEKTRSQVEIT